MKRRHRKIKGEWHNDYEFWVTVDDGKQIVTVMLDTPEAVDFLTEANAGVAVLLRKQREKAA